MKNTRKIETNGISIPHSALHGSGLHEDEQLTVHALPNALVLTMEHMTTMELVRAIDSLSRLSSEFLARLVEAAGFCDHGCGEGGCPFDGVEDESVRLPGRILEQAGLPRDAKLFAGVDPEDGGIVLTEACYRYDLSDVPPELLEILSGAGVCLGSLEELLMDEDVIYSA